MLYILYDQLRQRLIDLKIDWLFMILDQLEFRALAAAALAFFIVVLAGRPVIGWLRLKKIGDTGMTDAESLRARAQSKANTPTMGGVLICGAILGATCLLADLRDFYIVLALIVMVWLAAVGGVDDWLKLTQASRPGGSRQGLHAWEKLAFQLGLGLLVGVFLYHHASSPPFAGHVLNLPFQKTFIKQGEGVFTFNPSLVFLPAVVFVVFAMLMVAGVSNAANISDGMDGLAAGCTAIVAAGFTVLVYIAGRETLAQQLLVPHIVESDELAVFVSSIAGACLGFLWWNCSPAQVFMGDTGSLALGGSLAYVAVVIRQEIVLLMMCGIFLIEIGSVVIQVGVFKYTRRRTGTGYRVFRVAPIHHHFHMLGWTEQQVVTRFWIVTSILVVLSLALTKVR
ncbi:MAG: phospho-N-acetylmuramoyl-pentapeptide-transferase [Phycisphaeraceae bacterium]|nr:phospho-N-acetylmuramoyl-pentapeptide-transferase [Phycisphaeraceae bacterium]